MDFWLLILGSAVGAAVVTGTFGFVKNFQDKANEHAQWLRNHKLAVYTDFLRQARLIDIHTEEALTLRLEVRQEAKARQEALEPLWEANRQISATALRLAAPASVSNASVLVSNAIAQLGHTFAVNPTPEQKAAREEARMHFVHHLRQLEDRMREDLKIKD